MENKYPINPLKLLVLMVFATIIQLAGLLIPAGTLYWAEAWIMVGIITTYALVTMIYLSRHNPEMIKKRMSYKFEKGWDKIVIILMTLFFIPLYLIPGFDAGYGWSSVPFLLEAVGFVGVSFSLVVVFLVMKENAYLFRTVKVVEGQKLVTTGPYSFVRHPMYAAFMILFFYFPLALGSYYALIPGTLLAFLLIIRTHLEDKTLHKELKGYIEYAQKTRYRLLPYVW